MASFVEELKRRKVFRVAAVYAVVAWLLIQVADTVLPALQMPEWTISFVTVLFILGFPIAVILAWAYEVTPGGVKPDREVHSSQPSVATAAQPINYLILAIVLLVAGFQFVESFRSADNGTGISSAPGSTIAASGGGLKVNLNFGRSDMQGQNRISSSFDISDDGVFVVYTIRQGTRSTLYRRDLNEAEPVSIFESVGEGIRRPRISPDGARVIFASGDNTLSLLAADGGEERELRGNVLSRSEWVSNDEIVFVDSLSRQFTVLSVSTGQERQIDAAGIDNIRYPTDHIAAINSVVYVQAASPLDQSLRLLDLETGETRLLVEDADHGTYLPSGHLVFVRANDLWVTQFDPDTGEMDGDSYPVIYNIERATFGDVSLTLSDTGRLVYIMAATNAQTANRANLAFIDGGDNLISLGIRGGIQRDPDISGDGARLVFRMDNIDGTRDVWLYDLVRGSTNRLTFNGTSQNPEISPDGTFFIYEDVAYRSRLYRLSALEGGDPIVVVETNGRSTPQSISTDGEYLVFNCCGGQPWDIYRVSLVSDQAQPVPLVVSSFNDAQPEISPDGRWMVYTSNETGTDEVYVTSFPEPGQKIRVSPDGGWEPLWNETGTRIFYLDLVNYNIVYRDVIDTENMLFAEQQTFSSLPSVALSDNPNYAMLPDGSRAVVIQVPDTSSRLVQTVLIDDFISELNNVLPIQ